MSNQKLKKRTAIGKYSKKYCNHCGAKLKRPPRELLATKDIRKLVRIMKRYDLKQRALAKILDLGESTVNGWLSAKVNPTGKIKPIHFETLKKEGYI